MPTSTRPIPFPGLLLLCGCSGFRIPPPSGDIRGATIDCTVEQCAIRLSMRLEDLEGRPYQDTLRLEDFHVSGASLTREDGAPPPEIQKATPEELDYRTVGDHLCTAILLDQSGSVRDSDPHDARLSGADAVIQATLSDAQDPDRVALLAFPRVYASLGDLEKTDVWQPFTNDAALLQDTLSQMRDSEGNYTPIYDSIIETASYLDAEPASADATRAMLIMTDGTDTDSHASAEDVLDQVLAQDISLYIVALGEDTRFRELRDLAVASGGLFLSSDTKHLEESFSSLSDALYSNIVLTVHTVFDRASPALEAHTWYRITGTIHYHDELDIPFDERFYVGDLDRR